MFVQIAKNSFGFCNKPRPPALVITKSDIGLRYLHKHLQQVVYFPDDVRCPLCDVS